jgi:multiple sugar transport system ATP-binding protein
MNLAEARVDGRTVSFGGYTLPVPESAELSAYDRRTLILGIRPSDLEDTSVWQTDSLPTIEVLTDVTEELGSEVNILFRVDVPPVATEDTIAAASIEGEEEMVVPLLGEEGQSVFCARVDARTKARPGDRVRLSVDPARFHYFDKESGLRVGTGLRRQPPPDPVPAGTRGGRTGRLNEEAAHDDN